MDDNGFFDDLNAKDLLSFGLNAWSEKSKQDDSNATKATADYKARLYEVSQQRAQPAAAAKMPFNMTYALIGGGVLVAILLLRK